MNRSWEFSHQSHSCGAAPWLMGIVNVTPDSFSDGGLYTRFDQAVQHALSLVEQGAAIIDVGGESTRPGADPVSTADEIERVIPVIEELSKRTTVPISIDTYKAEVARQAIAAGAQIVNDISGLTFDPEMLPVCRDSNAGVICMHIQGTPQTMQQNPHYENVVEEIAEFFQQRLDVMTNAGIPAERIVLDPGIGFGKTAENNLEILSHIARFHELGRPVLIGHSRKGFLGQVLNRKAVDRTFGSVGISIGLAEQGVDILRVHDVAAHRDALAAWRTLRDRR
ncbi:MAG: dihydropteroate synthase [Planctomycetaceae bacterium]